MSLLVLASALPYPKIFDIVLIDLLHQTLAFVIKSQIISVHSKEKNCDPLGT